MNWHYLTTEKELNLKLTFNSGQVFNFIETTSNDSSIYSEWTGIALGNCYSFQHRRNGKIYFSVIDEKNLNQDENKENLKEREFVNIKTENDSINENEKKINYQENNKKKLIKYFSLDKNYKKILKDWLLRIKNLPEKYSENTKNEILKMIADSSYFKENINLENHGKINENIILQNIDNFSGLRLLNPALPETIFSFICSQNNHIKNITRMVNLLYKFGQFAISYKNNNFYYFPDLEILSKIELEENLKFGYRNKYIINSAKKLILKINEYNLENQNKRLKKNENSKILSNDSGLENFSFNQKLQKFFECHSYEKFIEILKDLPGISHKVADCIALYGGNFEFVVPFDAHMIRIGRELINNQDFLNKKKKTNNLNKKELQIFRDFFFDIFGSYAGLAQLFLFDRSLKKKMSK